jgi:hypothetical protein
MMGLGMHRWHQERMHPRKGPLQSGRIKRLRTPLHRSQQHCSQPEQGTVLHQKQESFRGLLLVAMARRGRLQLGSGHKVMSQRCVTPSSVRHQSLTESSAGCLHS